MLKIIKNYAFFGFFSKKTKSCIRKKAFYNIYEDNLNERIYIMKNENYIHISGWMINQLQLSGNELLVYAIIYGFSQDGQSLYKGGAGYLAECLNLSRQSVFSILKKLVDKDLVIKQEKTVNNVKFADYTVNFEKISNLMGYQESLQGVSKNLIGGSQETLQGGYQETLQHNKIIYNNNIYNNNIKNQKNINNKLFIQKKDIYTEVQEYWNLIAKRWNLAEIRQLTDKRKKTFDLRFKESGCSTVKEFFHLIDDAIMASVFLQGKKLEKVGDDWELVSANWICSFDFFLQAKSCMKALEGGYDDPDVRKHKAQGRWEKIKSIKESQKEVHFQ